MSLPTDYKERKNIPIATGVLDYFPDAIAEIARVSKAGNDQHNPGQPLHWARGKSTDQADTLIRHFMERGTVDTDGMRHSAKMAWRALALLQTELELARGYDAVAEAQQADLAREEAEAAASASSRCPHVAVYFLPTTEEWRCRDCGEPVEMSDGVAW